MNQVTRPIKSKKDLELRLAHARKAGSWMPWATTALAFTWWGGAAAYSLGKYGIEALQIMPPAELGGAIAMAAGPLCLALWPESLHAQPAQMNLC